MRTVRRTGDPAHRAMCLVLVHMYRHNRMSRGRHSLLGDVTYPLLIRGGDFKLFGSVRSSYPLDPLTATVLLEGAFSAGWLKWTIFELARGRGRRRSSRCWSVHDGRLPRVRGTIGSSAARMETELSATVKKAGGDSLAATHAECKSASQLLHGAFQGSSYGCSSASTGVPAANGDVLNQGNSSPVRPS